MGSMVTLESTIEVQCFDAFAPQEHRKVAHALSTINTDNLLFLPGPKPFTTNCIRATPILASHTSTSLQMNITEPAKHTHIANQAYTDIWVYCTVCDTSFIRDDLVTQAQLPTIQIYNVP